LIACINQSLKEDSALTALLSAKHLGELNGSILHPLVAVMECTVTWEVSATPHSNNNRDPHGEVVTSFNLQMAGGR